MGLVPGGNGRGMYRPGASNKAGRFRDGYGATTTRCRRTSTTPGSAACSRSCWSAIVDDGAIFYNHRPRVEHGVVRLPLGLDFGLPLRQIITWDRGTGIDVTLRQFCSAYEWVFLFAKPDFKLVDHARRG
jgi:site-specific DNA-methyltransferase (adenine-specific)